MRKIIMLCAVLNAILPTSTFASAFDVEQDPGHALFPNVTKVDDGLYTCPMATHPELRLVMERVTNANTEQWERYLTLQGNDRVVGTVGRMIGANGKSLQKGCIMDGASHAKGVLRSTSRTHNEVWMTYITADQQARHMDLACYDADEISQKGTGTFANNLKMYVSVTSSPEALLTSHIGIAASAEGVLQGRPKGISVDLHSFAAKVMLMRNPERRFMINSPVHAMEKILENALPADALFVGTKEIKSQIEDGLKMTLEDFKAHRPDLVKKAQDDAQKEIEKNYKQLSFVAKNEASMRRGGRYTEEEIEKSKARRLNDLHQDSLLEKTQEGTFVVSQDRVDGFIEETLTRLFAYFKVPCDIDKAEDSSAVMLELMKTHPPILSVDGVTRIKERFSIDHPTLQLEITADHPDYNWFFAKDPQLLAGSAFDPATSYQHLIAVDLAKLAAVR